MPRYFVLNKPYGVLSQFTREEPHHRVLGDLYPFPSGVYPVGRLDQDSEGLLIITDDKKLNHLLLDPVHQHRRTYLAQVEGAPGPEALEQLRAGGLSVRAGKKAHKTLPAGVRLLESPPKVPEREPPIRYRKNVPDSWIELELMEGKNRQVRRMCAAVGLPVLRLIRARIEDLDLRGLDVGGVREMKAEALYRLLGIRP
ncbi:MAG: pseudouridine synthase [Phaeodactylibacter sp.]|nr:pseudouridine synthase [Phaeodactylibacter sp.]MCB9275948.1 pseudouridine synthase [Lewinellaceae bacterium]